MRGLRQQAFDWVIDLQCLLRTGIFAWLANGKLSIGLDEAREGARGFYDHIVPRPSALTHAVDWYLRVLPVLGVPVDWQFEWLPPRPALATSLRRKWPVDGARWIVFQPGARWSNKLWPVESYAELVRLLAPVTPGFRFAILGGNEDRLLGEVIARGDPARCLDLTGRLSLPEMVEWIRLSELMVSNDTGPMRQLDRVLQLNLPCVPCMKARCTYFKPFECLRAIPPAAVFAAVQRRLAETTSAGLS